jgi:membrane-associated phospholipid phosphatase
MLASSAIVSADVPEWIDDFDSMFPVFDHSSLLDSAGSAAAAGTMLMPALLLCEDDMDSADLSAAAGTGAAVYGTAYLSKELLKGVFERNRPSSDGSIEENFSFPSGHAAMAFAAASYLQGMYVWNLNSSLENPNIASADKKRRNITAAAAWSMAALTSVLRVTSGEHYVSDVLAGAVLGSAVGFSGSYLLHFIRNSR